MSTLRTRTIRLSSTFPPKSEERKLLLAALKDAAGGRDVLNVSTPKWVIDLSEALDAKTDLAGAYFNGHTLWFDYPNGVDEDLYMATVKQEARKHGLRLRPSSLSTVVDDGSDTPVIIQIGYRGSERGQKVV